MNISNMHLSDAGVPVVIGGNNLPSPVGIGLTELPNIEGASGSPLALQFRHHCTYVMQISHYYFFIVCTHYS